MNTPKLQALKKHALEIAKSQFRHYKEVMNTPKLPPLPDTLDKAIHEFARAALYYEREGRIAATNQLKKAIETYAIAAIEAQCVPNWWLDVLDNFEKKERSPFLAYLAAGLVNELRTAMLASAPTAPQSWPLPGWEVQKEQGNDCEHKWAMDDDHPAHSCCQQCGKVREPQAAVVQQEPLGFISPKQVERIVDPDGEFGAYIPMRKTSAGNFTLAIYSRHAHQAKPQPLSGAARDVLAERQRQISAEGWTTEHDDKHADGDLALAAACYALPEINREVFPRKDMRDVGRSAGESIIVYDDVLCPFLWPWHGAGWKPKDRRTDLVKAGALILAEIERLDRAKAAHGIKE